MDLGAVALGLGFLAGMVSVLSPCVLPVLPLVLAPTVAVHPWGVAALAAGLIVAIVGGGLFVAAAGVVLGLNGGVVRAVAAVLLAGFGMVLLIATFQKGFARATGGLAAAGARLADRLSPVGPGGQFVLGALFGLIWSPCVGPTLGAASLLAAQGRAPAMVTAVMAAFGLGAALPLIGLGMLSGRAVARWRGRLLSVGTGGRRVLGLSAIAIAAFTLLGADRWAEQQLVAVSPAWLITLTTRF